MAVSFCLPGAPTYHMGEDVDILLPVLPFQEGGSATFTAEYFGVEEIHVGDSLIWKPEIKTGILMLGVSLRCPHG